MQYTIKNIEPVRTGDEVKRWEIYRNGEYIGTKHTIVVGHPALGMFKSEAI